MSHPNADDVFFTVGELRDFLSNFSEDTRVFLRDAGVFTIGIPKDFRVMWPCRDGGVDDLVLITDVHFANEPSMRPGVLGT